MAVDADTLERLVPDAADAHEATGRETLELHLARYAFAAEHAVPGRVLDMACGVGYGTKLLSERVAGASELLGVDISESAIAYAKERYAGARISYRVADAMSLRDDAGFDTIVSLETIEHLEHPQPFLERLAGLVRSGGVIVASVPTTPSVDVNPHHLHDFTERSFRAMGTALGLQEGACLVQVQSVPVLGVLRRSEKRLTHVRPRLLQWYVQHPRALAARMASTLRHGFTNRYLTLVWRKP